MKCPCCHGSGVLFGFEALMAKWPAPNTNFARILHELIEHPRGRTKTQLLDALYWDDPEGGALSNIIPVVISRSRADLHQFGFDIKGPKLGPNHGAGVYQIVQIEPKAEAAE